MADEVGRPRSRPTPRPRGGPRGQGGSAGARRQGGSAQTWPRLPRSGRTKVDKISSKSQWAEFVVDVWITPFNSVEFGI